MDIIRKAFKKESVVFDKELTEACEQAIAGLDSGRLKICTKEKGEWKIHAWLKEAILLYFRMKKMQKFQAGDFDFYDKIPVKKWSGKEGVRVVPQAIVRQGSFVEPNSVLMPCYINIGAYVGSGSLIDTWATVGSCAQVGRNVHVSGGVGLGGVLEPIQAHPVIIEDHVFLGSRSLIVEGVVVREGAVIAAGVAITKSTKIIDVRNKEEKVYVGEVPKNCVVIPGTRTKEFPAGSYQVSSPLIIGTRSESTNKKTSLNDCLREFKLSV